MYLKYIWFFQLSLTLMLGVAVLLNFLLTNNTALTTNLTTIFLSCLFFLWLRKDDLKDNQ